MSTLNPYCLAFGVPPAKLLDRTSAQQTIADNFQATQSSQRLFMITGIRGSGKTVFMTTTANKIINKNWLLINLNTSSNISLINQPYAILSDQQFLKNPFNFSKLSFSTYGINIESSKPEKPLNPEYEVSKLMHSLSNRKILITIDEVTNTPSMREFAGAFQIWLREQIPVYLLMTGLYENIKQLQDEKALTFLYRAPRISLDPLMTLEIKRNYEKNLNITSAEALTLAKMTKGYSFAFQALGYEVWNENGFTKKSLERYKEDLFEYSYQKIWNDISARTKELCIAIAKSESGRIKDIREILNIENNQINPYRAKLIEKGIVNSPQYGYLEFSLPYFKDFVLETIEEIF